MAGAAADAGGEGGLSLQPLPPFQVVLEPTPVVPPPTLASGFAKIRTMFLFRFVDKVSTKRVSVKGQERVLVVTPEFIYLCSADGSLHRLARLETLEKAVLQVVVQKRIEVEQVLLKFLDPDEPSMLLQFKAHPLNRTPADAITALKIIHAARLPHTGTPLLVERAGPEVDLLRHPELFGSISKPKGYLSPLQKVERMGSGGGPPRPPREFKVWDEPAVGTGQPVFEPTSPVGRGAVSVAEVGAAHEHGPVAAIGDSVRVRNAVSDQWQLGKVIALDRRGVVVSVGADPDGRVYPYVEKVQVKGVYVCTFDDLPVYRDMVPSHPVHYIKHGAGVKVEELVDSTPEGIWARLTGGGWCVARNSYGIDFLKYTGEGWQSPLIQSPRQLMELESRPPSPLDPTLGLHGSAFGLGTPVAPVPPIPADRNPLPTPGSTRSSIAVYVRIRPHLAGEGTESCVTANGEKEVVCQSTSFEFDRVMWDTELAGDNGVTQDDVLAAVEPPVTRALMEGHNACVLAYGASGSGKTHTMLGGGGKKGLVQHTLQRVLKAVEAAGGSFTARVAFFELHAEKVRDLIAGAASATPFKRMKVRRHPVTGPYIEGLQHIDALSPELWERLNNGVAVRSTSATHGNAYSSRSHAVLQLLLARKLPHGTMRTSSLCLVDLAGSERARRYRNDSMVEASAINLSLSVLRKVIDTLVNNAKGEGRSVLPPYRESVLTWLLADSFGGNAVTTFIANVSPSVAATDDTLATLRYASKAKGIVNTVRPAEDPHLQIVKELESRLREMKSRREEAIPKDDWEEVVAGANLAGALRAQVEGLSRRLMGVERDDRPPSRASSVADAEELSDLPEDIDPAILASALWRELVQADDAPKALANVITALGRQGKTRNLVDMATQQSPPSPSPPSSPREGIEALAKALASGQAEVLSPSPRASPPKPPPSNPPLSTLPLPPPNLPSTPSVADLARTSSPAAAPPPQPAPSSPSPPVPSTPLGNSPDPDNPMRFTSAIRVAQGVLAAAEGKPPTPLPPTPRSRGKSVGNGGAGARLRASLSPKPSRMRTELSEPRHPMLHAPSPVAPSPLPPQSPMPQRFSPPPPPFASPAEVEYSHAPSAPSTPQPVATHRPASPIHSSPLPPQQQPFIQHHPSPQGHAGPARGQIPPMPSLPSFPVHQQQAASPPPPPNLSLRAEAQALRDRCAQLESRARTGIKLAEVTSDLLPSPPKPAIRFSPPRPRPKRWATDELVYPEDPSPTNTSPVRDASPSPEAPPTPYQPLYAPPSPRPPEKLDLLSMVPSPPAVVSMAHHTESSRGKEEPTPLQSTLEYLFGEQGRRPRHRDPVDPPPQEYFDTHFPRRSETRSSYREPTPLGATTAPHITHQAPSTGLPPSPRNYTPSSSGVPDRDPPPLSQQTFSLPSPSHHSTSHDLSNATALEHSFQHSTQHSKHANEAEVLSARGASEASLQHGSYRMQRTIPSPSDTAKSTAKRRMSPPTRKLSTSSSKRSSLESRPKWVQPPGRSSPPRRNSLSPPPSRSPSKAKPAKRQSRPLAPQSVQYTELPTQVEPPQHPPVSSLARRMYAPLRK